MKRALSAILFLLALVPEMAEAKWIWSRETGFYNPKYGIKTSAEEQMKAAKEAFDRKNYDLARKLYKRVIQFFPDSPLCAEAQFMIGESYFLLGDYYQAHKAYKALVKEYPRHGRIQEVIQRQYRIGQLFCNGTKRKWLGVLPIPAYEKGIKALEGVIEMDRWSDLADDSLYEIGMCQYRRSHFPDSRETFGRLLQDYPSSEYASKAQYLRGMSSYSQIQGPEYDPTHAKQAKKDFEISKEEFPDSDEAKEAKAKIGRMDSESARSDYEIAKYYLKNRKVTAAIVYFRNLAMNYPNTDFGQKAQKVVSAFDALEQKKP